MKSYILYYVLDNEIVDGFMGKESNNEATDKVSYIQIYLLYTFKLRSKYFTGYKELNRT